MLISLQNVKKSYGSDLIFQNVTAKIEDHDRVGLVGANGAGKTTLLNIIAGSLEADEGEVARGTDLTIGYQRQNSGLRQGNTIREEMRRVFADVYELEAQMQAAAAEMAQAPEGPRRREAEERYHLLEDRFLARDGYHVDVKINTVLTGMGFSEFSEDQTIDKLSGGEQTRLAIAKLLLEEPRLLILDEPTNHLDFKTLGWLEDYLSTYKGGLLVVSHDRYFLDRLCSRIWEMDRGELTVFPGNYTRYLALRKERDARQQKLYEAQQEERAKLEDYVARNLVRASTTKMAQSRQKMLERMEPVEAPKPRLKPPVIRLHYSSEPVKDVLRVSGLEVAVGEGEQRKILIPQADFEVARGDKVAVIGGNGAGKTSLLKCLMHPEGCKGRVDWGRGVRLSYYEQGSENLDLQLTVLDTMWKHYPRSYETPLRSMLGALGLTGEDAFKQVGQLSGGERARLKLAIICLADSNVLLLDEPTNHLDLATKEVLEEALSAYTGTLVMISHDRYLLDRLPNRIMELEDGVLTAYKGGYTAYLKAKAEHSVPKKEPAAEQKPDSPQKAAYRRGKEARREEAQRRKDHAETEKAIAALEQELADIQRQLALPETAADYLLLQELCAQQQEKQQQLEECMDHWLLLEEQAQEQ